MKNVENDGRGNKNNSLTRSTPQAFLISRRLLSGFWDERSYRSAGLV